MERDLVQARKVDMALRLQTLAGHRWEIHALLRLDEAPQPPRRATLKRAIVAAASEPVGDNTLDRVLGRLVQRGLVRWRLDEEFNKVYALTPAGHQQVHCLHRLLRAIECDEDDGDQA